MTDQAEETEAEPTTGDVDDDVALADRNWRLVRDGGRPGYQQFGLEEVAAATAVEYDLRTVRVYDWKPSTFSLGYSQDLDTVDREYCEREGIDVTRRQTGGGGIYHDSRGDIAYTIVAPADEVPGDLMDCYALFCEPILEAFDRLGIDAGFASESRPALYEPSCYLRDVNPAHDIVVPTDDGPKKISGNAQYRQQDAVIQHGSISFELEPERHLGVFDEPDVTVDEFRDRVTSIREHADVSRDEAVRTFADALGDWCDADEDEWDDLEIETAEGYAARKYFADSWVEERRELTGDPIEKDL